MRQLRPCFLFIFALSTACSTVKDRNNDGDLPCPDFGPGGYAFNINPRSVELGSRFSLQAYFMSHPGSFEPLPSSCLRNVTLSDPDFGRVEILSDDQILVHVSERADTEKLVYMTADYRNESVTGRYKAYSPQSSPLIGVWKQEKSDCEGGAHIEDLVFSADGTFSVTWRPFEAYKDYWGEYNYDTQSSELTLDVEGGNFIPPDLKSGTVILSNNQLIMLTASLGTRDGLALCPNLFEKN